MPIGEHKAVTINPLRIGRVVLKKIVPENLGDVRHAHGRARVTRVGLLDGIHAQSTYGIGEFATGSHAAGIS